MVKTVKSKSPMMPPASRMPKIPPAEASSSALDTVRTEARIRRNRRHLLRVGLLFVVSGIALCVIVVWNRDTERMRLAVYRLEPFAEWIQKEIDRTGVLPMFYTPDSSEAASGRDVIVYLDPSWVAQLRKTFDPILIAYERQRPRLFLRGNGRAAILVDDGKAMTQWMDRAAFNRQMDQQEAFVEAELKQMRQSPPEVP